MTKRQLSVLIVEDLMPEYEQYRGFLEKFGCLVGGAGSTERAMEELRRRSWDVVLTDMHLTPAPEPEGLTVIREITAHYPGTVCIAMSSDPRLEIAEEARRLGASQFIKKPLVTADELMIVIHQAVDHKQLNDDRSRSQGPGVLPARLQEKCPDGVVLTDQHRRMVEAIASRPGVAVTIHGETGTGKEVIARQIHKQREKKEARPVPFVALNCANIKGDLAASLLFGHCRGAFTGADRSAPGAIGEADGGILFLDEIHTLTPETQSRLLRVLNDGTYNRVGETTERQSTFQVIIATTRDPDEEVEQGRFLLDLRMRLMGIDLHLPPLRERSEDFPLLISLFLHKENVDLDDEEFTALVDKCRGYYWRGNIRQLYRVLQSWLVMSQFNDESPRTERLPEFRTMFPPGQEDVVPSHYPADLRGLLDEVTGACRGNVPLDKVMATVEKAVISGALASHSSITDVYKALGIGRTTLDTKRKKYGL